PSSTYGTSSPSSTYEFKRARVESIIQGMTFPPTPPAHCTSLEAAFGHERERGGEMPRESKRRPRVPQQGAGAAGQGATQGGRPHPHAEGCQQLKEQLCFLEQQLRKLQEKFSQVCDSEDAAQTQEGAEKVPPLPGKPGDRPDKDGAAALNSVLKTMWPKAASHLLQQHCSLPVPGPGARREYFAAGKCRKPLAKPPPMNALGSLGSTQAEALSGASGKSSSSHTGSFSSNGVRKPCQVPSMGYPLSSPTPVQDSQLLSQLLGCSPLSPWGSGSCGSPSALERGPLEPLNLHWGTVKLRPRGGVIMGTGHVWMGWAGRAAACRLSLTPRQIQEALTPGHLKKAKLMFFFTRYPSSTLLKTYFLDVQFSRCITSQLIKWFSNFREFYYIQVEKFARQALLEGVVDAGALRVSRDSELFRALNTHYNKGNDFEVPGRFLEVASLTLREFFSAVRAGKDADPSWKKPIYKIISKLDSDIPEGFKAASCSQEL
ncbi:Prospero homeobox protein 2, partial [Podiceps cristatus]